MSDARSAIFAALEAASPGPASPPQRVEAPPLPDDAQAQLRQRVAEAGGLCLSVADHAALTGLDELDGIDWATPLCDAEHVFSTLDGLDSRGVGASAESKPALAALEFCLLRGAFAVVENGAVWHVPATPREREAALLAEHLVLVVEAHDLVATLHQAYERIDLRASSFGWFLCGPSKTADIEQALVLGAHGPRTMRLILVGGSDFA